MSDNELQAKLSVQLGQALAGFKALSGELRDVKRNVADLTKGTNQLQQESAKTAKTQVDGAKAAGKATKTFNDYVAEQVNKLVEAHRRTKALEEARRRLNLDKPKLGPSVDEFRALDQAKAAMLGVGNAQRQLAEPSGPSFLNARFLSIASAATLALKAIGEVSKKYRELETLNVGNFRKSGAAAVSIEQSMQSANIVDVGGLTEEALHLKGVASQEQLQEFVQQTTQHNPDIDDDRMRGMLQWYAQSITPKGGSETMARMAGLAPGASIPQLDRMTSEYMKGSGGRAMGDSESKSVRDLVNTGFFTAPQALSLVSSLSAYERSGEISSIVEKLKPPKATGKMVEDSAAGDKWWQSVGYLRGQPGGSSAALQQVAPEIAAELKTGALGRRYNTTEYRLTTGVDPGTFAPDGNRAKAEVAQRAQDRLVEISGVPGQVAISRAEQKSRRMAYESYNKNMAAGGDNAALARELADGALNSLPFQLDETVRLVRDKTTTPGIPQSSAPSRPLQVEIVRDNTVRPLTH